jgi:hypothetical protein
MFWRSHRLVKAALMVHHHAVKVVPTIAHVLPIQSWMLWTKIATEKFPKRRLTMRPPL